MLITCLALLLTNLEVNMNPQMLIAILGRAGKEALKWAVKWDPRCLSLSFRKLEMDPQVLVSINIYPLWKL